MNHEKSIIELGREINARLDKLCIGAELVCDQILQDMSNRYKVRINTDDQELIISDRKGKMLINSDPFYITVNKLFNMMSMNFENLFKGGVYEPKPIKNSVLPDMVVLSSQEGDWIAVYIHGKSVLQDHKISLNLFADIMLKHKIENSQILEITASDNDDLNLRSNGTFPDLLEYLLTEYDENGNVSDIEQTEVQLCGFDEAWRGPCKNAVIPGKDRCKDHIDQKCSCGKLATHNCDQTMGPMVCGRPLCDSCRCNH